MSLLTQWKGVSKYMIDDAGTFFTNYNESHGIGYPLLYLALTCTVVMAPPALLSVVLNISDPPTALAGILVFAGFGLFFWLISVVESLIVHAVAYLFGARGLSTTFEAFAFPAIVRYGLWWFPGVNAGLGLYGFYLQIKALAAFHDLSTGKAAIAGVAGMLFAVPVFVITLAVAIAFVLNLGGPV